MNENKKTIGIKHDQQKNRMDLLPFESLEEIARVLTYGAIKYAPDNWKKVPDAQARYEAALLRHFSAHKRGEKIDPESGLSHLAHVGCNALFLIWFNVSKIVPYRSALKDLISAYQQSELIQSKLHAAESGIRQLHKKKTNVRGRK